MSTTHTPPAADPAFWTRITSLYNDTVAHAFNLTGNVYDWIADPMIAADDSRYKSVASFLEVQLGARFDVLITVHPARGLAFPLPEHRARVLKLLNLEGTGGTTTPLISQLRADEAEYRARANGATPKPPIRGALNFSEVIAFLDALLSEDRYLPGRVREGDAGEEAPVRARCAVIIYEAELLVPPFDLGTADMAQRVTLARLLDWARSPEMIVRQHMIVMLAESRAGLHPEIRRSSSRWEPIDIPRPATAEREAFAASRLAVYPDLELADDLTPGALARMTGMLTLRDIEDVIFRGMGAGAVSRAIVADRKAEVIANEFGDVLEVIEPRFGFEAVGGYAYVKDWLARRVVAAIRAGRRLPRNILLPGPPGTGKTQLAEAVGFEAGVTFIKWQPSKFMIKWVGDSEKAFERVTRAILAVAPCVVFIDEVDAQFRDREATAHASSQADDRILGMFLNFVEDPATAAAGVLFIAATNHPERMDGAIRSRFSRVIPVLPPTDEDRPEVIAAQARELLGGLPPHAGRNVPEVQALAARTRGWTGRHIRGLIDLARELVDDGESPADALRLCVNYYKAPDLVQLARYTDQALAAVTDLQLLPPEYREQATRPAEAPATEPEQPRRRERRQI